MADRIIRDYKKETIEIQEKLDRLVKETGSGDYAVQMQEIRDGIVRSDPSMMFYGIYNAGKSTLLNAVFGEKKASTNDVPETHKVTPYRWGEYTLVDTPGLDGPPEDERITTGEVKKHDIIMFVIDDSDNFDSDVITKKIVEILETKKPSIIVINKKNDSNDIQLNDIKNKMKRNIHTISNVEQTYEVIWVDAASALRGKLEGKQALIDDSNIVELEYQIKDMLKSVDSVTMLRVPLDLMIQVCDGVQAGLEQEAGNEEIRKLCKLKSELFQTKEQTRQTFSSKLHSKIDGFADDIYRMASQNQKADIPSEVYEGEIQELAKECLKQYAEKSRATVGQFTGAGKLDLSLPKIPKEMSDRPVLRQAEDKEKSPNGIGEFLEELPMPSIVVDAISIPIEVIVVAIKILEKIIFGDGKESKPDLDEWNIQQSEAAQKRAVALRELRNRISAQMDRFESQIKEEFERILEESYMECDAGIGKTISELEGKDSDRIKKQESAMEIRSMAERLLEELKR